MRDFTVPALSQNIRDLEYCTEDQAIFVSEVIGFGSFGEDEQISFLENLENEIQNANEDIASWICDHESNAVNYLYACVRYYEEIAPHSKFRVVEILCLLMDIMMKNISNVEELDIDKTKAAFKLTVYLLSKLCLDAETIESELKKDAVGKLTEKISKMKLGKKSANTITQWPELRSMVLKSLHSSLKSENVDFKKLWACGLPEDSFLDLYWRLSEMLVLQNPKLTSCATDKAMLEDLVCVPVHRFHEVVTHVVVSSFSHSIHQEESFPSFVVGILECLVSKFDDGRLPRDLILEIGRFDSQENSRDASGTKNLGIFIECAASSLPALLLGNLSVVVPHLNATAYALRCSIVRALGSLVAFLKPETAANTVPLLDESQATREKLLDLVGERAHDTSSYVRGASLSTLASLVEHGALPVSHIVIAADIAIERILDKSSIVRKQALSLLTCILENNPFGDTLIAEEYTQKIKALPPIEALDDEIEESETKSTTSEDTERRSSMQSTTTAALHYYQSAVQLITRLEHGCKEAERLVSSKITTDVSESMRYLTVAMQFKLPGAMGSMNKLLCLIWDDRESGKIKKELLEAFESYFISEPVMVGKQLKRKLQPPNIIANNLISLVNNATLAELTSLEQVIMDLVSDAGTLGRISLPQLVVEQVWMQATQDATDDIAAALCFISMATKESKTFFHKSPANVSKLMDLCKRPTDYPTVCYGAKTLVNLLKAKCPGLSDPIIQDLVMNFFNQTEARTISRRWYPAAEEMLHLLFCTSRPDSLCGKIIRNLHKMVVAHQNNQQTMSQFFFVIGQLTINLLVYSELTTSMAKQARRTQEGSFKAKADDLEAMIGGQPSDDYEDAIQKRISEHELVGAKSLLGHYVPMIVEVVELGVTDTNRIHPELMESSVLALCKMLCVSEKMCEKYLGLVFTALRDCEMPTVRSNIMVSLGDLAVRFPNVVEPYTTQIYRRLRDPNTAVRKTSLMVLTHLILNDMVKARGEISEIAACLEDEESERICDLANLFFTELSHKGNSPIYNLLPDCIGRLSKDVTLSTKKFQKIVKFLVQFITLEKQAVSITEKLAHRLFAATGLTSDSEEGELVENFSELKMIRDLAFALSHLKLNDKSVRKLGDSLFKCYRPALVDDFVYGCFQSIIKKARQQGLGTKIALEGGVDFFEDWQARMDKIRDAQLSNKDSTNKALHNKLKRVAKGSKENTSISANSRMSDVA